MALGVEGFSVTAFNRTNVELKHDLLTDIQTEIEAFNRTNVELKLIQSNASATTLFSF